MRVTFTAMSTSLATEVVTRLQPLVEKHYQLNEKLLKALEEVPLNRTQGDRGIMPYLPIAYPSRVHFSHVENRDPLVSNDPQTSSHERRTRASPLSLGENGHGNFRRSDEMAANVEPGWHQVSRRHQHSFSMGGGQFGDNTHQPGPSHGGQKQGAFIANNNSSAHPYVPLNQPTMVGNPSSSTYMPYQLPIVGTSHYKNAPGYGHN